MTDAITPARARLLELASNIDEHHVAAVLYVAESTVHARQLYAPPAAPSNVIYGPWKRTARRRRRLQA